MLGDEVRETPPVHAGDSTSVDGFSFATEVKVRFAETDAQGVAHNAAYLVWFEVARVAYLAEYAGGYQALRDHGFEALTIEAHVRYAAPLRFDDRIVINTRCGDVRGARFRFEYALPGSRLQGVDRQKTWAWRRRSHTAIAE